MNIRDVRLSLGLTQAELAARWGVQNTTISRWEREPGGMGPYPGMMADALRGLVAESGKRVVRHKRNAKVPKKSRLKNRR